MKNILLLLSLFFNVCFGQTTVKGTLTSLSNTSFSIKTDQSPLNDYAGLTIGQGKTDEKGQFSSIIDLKSEQSISLFIGKAFFILWVKPNTILNIQETLDGRYTFSGAMNKENFVLYETGLMQPYTVPPNIGMNSFDPERQLKYLDSIEIKRLFTLTEVEKDNNLSKRFLSFCRAEIAGTGFFNKNQYPALLKATNKITDEDIPKDYFSFWDRFILREDSTSSSSYQNALQNFIEYKALRKISKSQIGTEIYWREIFTTTDTLLYQYPLSLQKQKSANLLLLIKYFNLSDFTATEIEDYKKQFPSSSSIPVIENLWQKKKASTSANPSFRLKNIEGKFVDIKDFRGKVLYVDFWGSWCKACLVNMPHSELLKQKFKGNDVVFLYLDFYDTQERWLNAIKKYKIGGIHLKAEKADEEYFNSVFNISQGFPRYALIDKNGKLVTISAPQPQDYSTYELIKKYLNE